MGDPHLSSQLLVTPVVSNSALTTGVLGEGLEHIGQERREERGSMFVNPGKHLSMLGKGFLGDLLREEHPPPLSNPLSMLWKEDHKLSDSPK